MHLWTAINIDGQLEEVKKKARCIEQEIGFKSSAFDLPSHISLKISFPVDSNAEARVIETILAYYKTLKPFSVDVKGIEVEGTIVWIRIKENAILDSIHKELDRILSEKHGITPHPFDLDFKFHSTLFLDPDKEKIATAYNKIKKIEIPSSLRAGELIIGASPSGEIGTYSVIRTVALLEN